LNVGEWTARLQVAMVNNAAFHLHCGQKLHFPALPSLATLV
jgi:hypothetical protein